MEKRIILALMLSISIPKKLFYGVILILTHQLLAAQTVFISSKGKKYHTENCKLLAKDKKGLSLEQAKMEGYKACKKCIEKKVESGKKKTSNEGKKNEMPSGSIIYPSNKRQHFLGFNGFPLFACAVPNH
ncbi:MAG: hypothetical protein MUF75_10120 [Bacteroidia bacterium]|jgi:hypothetical protein|nr:hypothetical protein [Bacteroidia bacterium]